MTRLHDFHTSVFDFATQAMTAVESHRGDSGRSSQVTATAAFAGDGISRKFIISQTTDQNTTHRRCVVVREHKDTTEPVDLEDNEGIWGRAGHPYAA